MSKNFTKQETFYINNRFLKTLAIKLLRQKPETRSEQDREDFWYVFHKLNPGYLGRDLTLRARVESFVLYSSVRVEVND
ncbi:hypothetical protein pEaSNUABM50_00167 [Erwinia phage pEa_SNUABM_50]|uniref:Uncharacterized protein n=3 Tax=Eneladusvirus BF TaxID=2560751 RepID=A0A7L8ZN88_9CAUD|nr:hypothetical protein pEaSNUABM12_00169 [Erwinia phage pEa_SNUABM_12]QOI71652.1 hypothetical protein pEaSNUABM47_00168 [Erwinia phage pEa_SNUABM_47]QOI72191.1 hypothetical protein pEaSNUABM50_00167 [Erwinia phage pEa_SNUABM_50]QXO11317.1 hypothetical protein pEaSNUABM19_00171 [Erwinia phage pEa_SNUABM_19]QXO11865.1 hypothetical protein pEaSNUABM44_00169 [Erwinia phage pEa_SNUABM_44]QXO12417.1 hypothetical protein pEaSNUABM49_00171 [Erwinia phage pEa_SNUABM_49]